MRNKRFMISSLYKNIFILLLIYTSILHAKEKSEAPASVVATAEQYASWNHPGSIVESTPYYAADGKNISAWCFTFYCGNDLIPTAEQIKSQVLSNKTAVNMSLEEIDMHNKNKDLIHLKQAQKQYQENWERFRGDDEFATIFVRNSVSGPYVSNSYPSLPLHYIAVFDAEIKAMDLLTGKNISEGKFYYEDAFHVYLSFSDDQEEIFINLYAPSSDWKKQLQSKTDEHLFDESFNYIGKTMTAVTDCTLIEGMSDYDYWGHQDYSGLPWIHNGCVPTSIGTVLAYWDDHPDENGYTYEDLIDEGDYDYQGEYYGEFCSDLSTTSLCRTNNWYKWTNGYKGLIVELALMPELYYTYPNGTWAYAPNVASAIEKYCNHSTFNNRYDFECDYSMYADYEDSWSDFKTYLDQTYKKPFYCRIGTNYPEPAITHAIVGIGYGTINGGTTETERYRYYNWGNKWANLPERVCDYDLIGYDYDIITITPDIPAGISGTINSSVTWQGAVYIEGNIIVDNNATLTIQPGTIIRSTGFYSIYVKEGSKIIAQGTESEPIIFKHISGTSRDSWKNIFIYGSDNEFEHCKFYYGQTIMVDANKPGDPSYRGTNNTFYNCTFYKMNTALRFHENSATVSNCTISECRYGLVCYNNTEIELNQNVIESSELDGIYSWSNNLIPIERSVIRYNSIYGIRTQYSDVINLKGSSGEPGYNTISDNSSTEIYASLGSPTVSSYFNSIHDDSGLDLYNYSSNSNNVTSIYDWWGEVPPDPDDFSGSIVTYGYQYAKPGWDGTITGGMSKSLATQKSKQDKSDELKENISKDDKKAAKEALKELYALVRSDYKKNELSLTKNYIEYLNQIYDTDKDNELGLEALNQKILWQMLNTDYQNSIELSIQALKEFTSDEKMCVHQNLAMMYIERDDQKNAEKTINVYISEYSFDEFGIEMLESSYSELISRLAMNKAKLTEENLDVSDNIEASLEQNYPNPGNPSTAIKFTVPQDELVVLRIYNMMGQEVKTLVNEVQSSGQHTIIWDGKNNTGNFVSSGIYIYHLSIGEKTFSKKLTILK